MTQTAQNQPSVDAVEEFAVQTSIMPPSIMTTKANSSGAGMEMNEKNTSPRPEK
jgi:hypothetical protein